jgi:hypothetical protein
MAMRDGVGRASFDAVSAKNASRVVDVVDTGVTLSGRDPIGIGVFSGFNVNTIRRTSGRAQETANTLFQPIFVAMQNVNPTITRLEVHWFVRVVFRNSFPEDIPEGYAETLYERSECFTHFAKYGWHKIAV